MADLPTVGATGALLAVSGVHGYWAAGGRWPGHDDASLAELVVGTGTGWPGAPATWAVAGLLGVAAGLVAAAGTGRGGPLAVRGARGVSAAMLLRGAAGLALSGRGDGRFARLDVALYSPLCLAIGAASARAARGR